MKNLAIIASLAVLSLAACSKNEVYSDTSMENAVSFTTYAGRALTKANGSLVNGSNFSGSDNQHIGVYAWHKNGEAFQGNEDPNFLRNVDVTLANNGSSASTSYANLQYWPKDADAATFKNVISFVAYYPYGDAHISATPAKGLGAYNFIVDSDVTKQTDFMTSDVKADITKAESDGGAVSFAFHHQLTKVQFYMNKAADYGSTVISVKDVKLTQVKTTGTLTTVYDPATNETSAVWAAQGTPVDFDMLTAAKTLGTAGAKLDADSDAYTFLMLPQTLGDEVLITIDYTVKTGDYATVEESASVKLNTAVIGTEPLTAWNANQNIKYTFTIGLDAISFKASAAAWDAISQAGLAL